MSETPLPTSYRLLGPPDLLQDLAEDFEDIGWQVTAVRWQAVITTSVDDAEHTAPAWPTEVTLVDVRRQDHGEACQQYFSGV